jgi:hypothetical protein
MLDTNALNGATDYRLTPNAFVGRRVFVTHVQRNELSQTSSDTRRQALLDSLTAIGPQKLPTESSVWDISEWDEAKWSADDGVFERLFSEITELDRQTGKGTTKINRQRDAVIAETALKNGLILISNDRNLTAVSRNANISVMTLEEFLQTFETVECRREKTPCELVRGHPSRLALRARTSG